MRAIVFHASYTMGQSLGETPRTEPNSHFLHMAKSLRSRRFQRTRNNSSALRSSESGLFRPIVIGVPYSDKWFHQPSCATVTWLAHVVQCQGSPTTLLMALGA